jgi:hypothetical protein
VCAREITGVTALSLSCSSTRFCLFVCFLLGRYRDMICDGFVAITATAAWVHRGVEACKETPLRSVSADLLHSHMSLTI